MTARLHTLADRYGRAMFRIYAGLRRSHRIYVAQRVTSREAIASGKGRLPMVRVEADRWVVT